MTKYIAREAPRNPFDVDATLRLTKALSDRQRLRILMMLRSGELCVCQIVAVLALAPSTVSKHLSLLHAAGLVVFRKAGRWAYYRRPATTGASPLRSALAWLDRTLAQDPAIAADARKLKNTAPLTPENLCPRRRKSA